MSSYLPYDATPPPESRADDGMQVDEPLPTASGVPNLDMALDDYPTPENPIPDSVKTLMGRMSQNKVYLMEESPAILHMDGEKRLRNPKIKELAERLNRDDPSEWLAEISASSSMPLRPNTLYVSSELIAHMSTSKLFSWASSLGAKPTAIEWLNDTTLHLLFPTPADTLLALSLLAKAGFDPAQGDDPLMEHAAHPFPIHLLPQEKEEVVGLGEPKSLFAEEGGEQAPANEDGVQPRGRGAIASRGPTSSTSDSNPSTSRPSRLPAHDRQGEYDLPPLAQSTPGTNADGFHLAPGINPLARIAVRYGLEADSALRKQSKDSEWYRAHGRGAGKEVSGARRPVGRSEGPSWGGRGEGEVGRAEGGMEFARRIGRERKPYSRPDGREERANRSARPRFTQEDLDAQMDGYRRGEETTEIAHRDAREERYSGDRYRERERGDGRWGRGGGRNGGGGGGRERRPQTNREDLDKELDDLFAARTS
ncbi:hypothetical protein IAT38_004864 [Cryptococcus sp. DSM 104549]